jgi:cytochrome c-type biogenesis protein CcmH
MPTALERAGSDRETFDAGAAGAAASLLVAGAAARRPSRRLLTGVTMFVLLVAASGYAWRGDYARLVEPAPTQVATTSGAAPDHAGDDAQIDAMLARLAQRLKTNPDDAEGWAMLARSYAARGRFDEAMPAFRKVVALRPDDAQALADYADGLASARGHSLAGEPEQLVKKALAIDPRNVKALALAGTIAFDRADFAGAIAYWEQALGAIDPASDFARQLQGALADARERAGLAPVAVADGKAPALPAAPAIDPGAAPASRTVTGRVSIAASLRSVVAADDTVFIYARPASGSKMPLAVLRKRGADLPLDFTLDDSLAMSPAARLSSASEVIVSARVSKSGSASPQSGDLQVTSAPVAVGGPGLRLEIAETVR